MPVELRVEWEEDPYPGSLLGPRLSAAAVDGCGLGWVGVLARRVVGLVEGAGARL